MHHTFSVAHAVEYGVNEAVFIQNFIFWISHNRANGRHFYDGRTWTYNSVRAFADLFPYYTAKQIRGALDRLVEKSVLVTGNYNSDQRDRTVWYAFSDEDRFLTIAPSHLPSGANAVAPKDAMHLPATANAHAPKGKSLIRTDINTDVKPSAARGSRLPNDWILSKDWGEEALRVQPSWTPDHVRFEADKFRDYWIGVAGKAGVKLDWLATWRNWVRNAGPMKAEATKKHAGWWRSDETALAMANEVGVGAALTHESRDAWHARIQAAIDNGGTPPAPKAQHSAPMPQVEPPASDRDAPLGELRAGLSDMTANLKRRFSAGNGAPLQ
ncbi:hypothetical protein ABLT15_26855 [Paraburkholderia tropica]|uniref:hypothetical protein n=1 Tax=Paraburkholderia tropica TaxID=92647 RepID=UPI0032B43E23